MSNRNYTRREFTTRLLAIGLLPIFQHHRFWHKQKKTTKYFTFDDAIFDPNIFST